MASPCHSFSLPTILSVHDSYPPRIDNELLETQIIVFSSQKNVLPIANKETNKNVFFSWGCYIKVSPNGWFQSMEMKYLTVLEAEVTVPTELC